MIIIIVILVIVIITATNIYSQIYQYHQVSCCHYLLFVLSSSDIRPLSDIIIII